MTAPPPIASRAATRPGRQGGRRRRWPYRGPAGERNTRGLSFALVAYVLCEPHWVGEFDANCDLSSPSSF